MADEQPRPKGLTPIQDARAAASFLVLAAQILAAPVEVFLRVRFGRHYFGIPSAVALIVVPMWSIFWPDEDPGPLLIFWGLFILMQLRARVEGIRMSNRGEITHSRYNGYPRLARLFPRMAEEKIKGNIEPWLVMWAGVLMLGLSLPLGSYLVAAGFSLGCVAGLMESVARARARQLHDAWLEQQDQAERFRSMQRGRR